MPSSMTGFGRAVRHGPEGTVVVEIRSVNHRHCDVRVVSPSALRAVQDDIARRVRARVGRGRVEVHVLFEETRASDPGVVVRSDRVRTLLSQARALAGDLGLEDDLSLSDLLAVPGVVEVAPRADRGPDPHTTLEATDEALVALSAARAREGRALTARLRSHAAALKDRLARIRARSPRVVAQRRAELERRLDQALGADGGDGGRIAQEVSLLLDRLDLEEELSRMDAHLAHLDELLGVDLSGSDPGERAAADGASPARPRTERPQEEPVGRRLEFLLQEMVREVNTIGSKASDVEIGREVVEAKAEIERLREQGMNIE